MKSISGIIVLLLIFVSLSFSAVIGDRILISSSTWCQNFTQATYNIVEDEYLVVWEDNRNMATTHSDIYGQIVRGDGTLRGENFVVCNNSASQWWPHLDYDPITNRYLVVFSDNRNAETDGWMDNYDVYAALLDKDGKHIETDYTEDDTTFAVCTDFNAIHYPDVAYNTMTGTFMVVWADYRNATALDEYEKQGDIYGQIVDGNGDFIIPASRDDNMVVHQIADEWLDVPVVTYSGQLNEWLVVFAHNVDNMSNSNVLAQRVSYYGVPRNQNGEDSPEAIVVAENTGMHHDPLQPRAQFNYEYVESLGKSDASADWCECLIVWKAGMYPDYNLWGQRVAFKLDTGSDSTFVAYLIDKDGNAADNTTMEVCMAQNEQNAPDIAWSTLDNEFFLHWEDARNGEEVDYLLYNTDQYAQRLHVGPDTSIHFLSMDRNTETTFTENCELDLDEGQHIGGNLVGVAHNSYRNEFLAVFAVEDTTWADSLGNDLYGRIVSGTMPTSVNENTLTPVSFTLKQNYPNPFNPQTTIDYQLAKAGEVSIDIYDITGKRVRRLLSEYRAAGVYQLQWNGLTDEHKQAASGIYFYKMSQNGETLVRKMTLVR